MALIHTPVASPFVLAAEIQEGGTRHDGGRQNNYSSDHVIAQIAQPCIYKQSVTIVFALKFLNTCDMSTKNISKFI